MSKMSQAQADLLEQAAELGFETIQGAEENGYRVTYDNGKLFLDYEHGMKRVELASKYHVHIDTVDKWLKDYKKGKTEWLER